LTTAPASPTTPRLDELTSNPRRLDAQRVDKLRRLDAMGYAPPYRFVPTHDIAQFHATFGRLGVGEEAPDEVAVHGRVDAIRRMAKAIFVDLRDPEGARLQMCVQRPAAGPLFDGAALLDTGDRIAVHGRPLRTQKGELSVRAEKLVLLSKCLQAAPNAGLDAENRLREPWLDRLFDDAARQRLLARARVKRALHDVMAVEGYVEIDPPLLSRSYGGAAARPFVTESNGLGGEQLFLQISPEIALKKCVVGGLDAVYAVTRNFRNEGIDPSHTPEFDAFECYRVGADYVDMMDLTERIFRACAQAANGTTRVTCRGAEIDFAAPWRRVRMRDAVCEALKLGDPDLDALRDALQEHSLDASRASSEAMAINLLFEARVQETLVQPTIVLDYPEEISPLTRAHRAAPGLVERFEAFIGGTEFANAYTELNDPFEQERRLRLQEEERRRGNDEAHPLDWSFVDAMRCGFPPTGGLGIGLDRMVMLLTSSPTIRAIQTEPLVRSLPEEAG